MLHKDRESQNKAEGATRAHHCSLWCCFNTFFGWIGGEQKQAEGWCFALGCSMTSPLPVSEQQQWYNTALECSFTLIYSLFQKTDSESEWIFQKVRKNIVKGKRIISVYTTVSWGASKYFLNLAAAKGTFSRPARLKGFPHFTQPWISCVRPVGGCFVGPVAPNTVRLVFHLCQSCLVRYNATPSHAWGTLPAIIILSINPIILCECCFLFSHLHHWFCWYQYLHLHQLH